MVFLIKFVIIWMPIFMSKSLVHSMMISNLNLLFETFNPMSMVRFYEFNDQGYNITDSCIQDMFVYLDGLHRDIFWAVKCWIATALLICGMYFRNLFLIKPNLWIEASASAVTHTVWSMILFWIILTSVSQYRGFLGQFLSSNHLIPLSKLSNCILLIHPLITRVIILNSEQTFHLSFTILLAMYIGIVILVFLAGFVLHMFFEAPLTALLQNTYLL